MVDTPRGRNLRPPPRTVEVVTVERIAPRLVAITFGGDALRGFPEPPPTSHIKIFLPDAEGRLTLPVAGPDGLVWPNGRPPMRTYTHAQAVRRRRKHPARGLRPARRRGRCAVGRALCAR